MRPIVFPAELTFGPLVETRGAPRKYHANRAATAQERDATRTAKNRVHKIEHIAVLDFETDPFNAETEEAILPFAACLYTEHSAPVVIWNENFDSFTKEVLAAIEALEEPHTIYAHNGGKFDFMFLIHRLRGQVSFKGRGIMSAKFGIHELRDSFHIIPEKLASYRKDDFDYALMSKATRNQWRPEITEYLINDCKYLHDIVKAFVERFGFKISIGQAAMSEMKKVYQVGRIGQNVDAVLRQWFFGGRVECLAGKGHFVGDYNLYDVNSMYPYAMANYAHPQSSNYERIERGKVGRRTVFIDLTCHNYGALVRRGENGETSATQGKGRFFTTIWEYETALELGLIDHVQIHAVINNEQRGDFSKVIIPWYDNRLATKAKLSELTEAGKKGSREYLEVKKDDMFWKFLMNNSYGKYAQNPRNYKEHFFTDLEEKAPEGFGDFPKIRHETLGYAIWEKPAPRHVYNNVGTAASITGAARSILMRAIIGAVDPIYCDTDSLIAKSVDGIELDKTKLGAWDLEAQFSEVIVAGKKLYYCTSRQTGKGQVKSKGVSGLVDGVSGEWRGFTRDDMLGLLRDDVIAAVSKAPTLTKAGQQFYMHRDVRATAKERVFYYGRKSGVPNVQPVLAHTRPSRVGSVPG